jgi:hypothetical protein
MEEEAKIFEGGTEYCESRGLEKGGGGTPADCLERKCLEQSSSIEARASGWSQGSPMFLADIAGSNVVVAKRRGTEKSGTER